MGRRRQDAARATEAGGSVRGEGADRHAGAEPRAPEAAALEQDADPARGGPRNGSSSSSIRRSAGLSAPAASALAGAGPDLAGQRPRDHVRDVEVADRDRVRVAEARPGPPRPRSRRRCPGSRSAGAVGVGGVGARLQPGGHGRRPAQRVGPALLDAERVEDPVRRGRDRRRVRRQAAARPGPGRRLAARGAWKWRTVAAYAWYASLPVTFCSKTARSRRWKTRPVAGSRSPACGRASSATSGWPRGELGEAGRGRRAARPPRRPGPAPSSAPGPVAGRDQLPAPSRRRLSVAGPSGVRVAHQNAPSAIRKHGSCRATASAAAPTVVAPKLEPSDSATPRQPHRSARSAVARYAAVTGRRGRRAAGGGGQRAQQQSLVAEHAAQPTLQPRDRRQVLRRPGVLVGGWRRTGQGRRRTGRPAGSPRPAAGRPRPRPGPPRPTASRPARAAAVPGVPVPASCRAGRPGVRWPGPQPADHCGQFRRQVLHPVGLDVAQRPGQLGPAAQRTVDHAAGRRRPARPASGRGPGQRRHLGLELAAAAAGRRPGSWAGVGRGDPVHRVARVGRDQMSVGVGAGREQARARPGRPRPRRCRGAGRTAPRRPRTRRRCRVHVPSGSSTQIRASIRRTPSTSSTTSGARTSAGGPSGRHDAAGAARRRG